MLHKVTAEEIKVNIDKNQEIIIPQGVLVEGKEKDSGSLSNFTIKGFDWFKKKYPQLAKKNDIKKVFGNIIIPEDRIIWALKLKFAFDDSGNCKDIYTSLNKKFMYCRMETSKDNFVVWYTCTPDWLEPNSPLRSDMLIQVVNDKGEIIHIERNFNQDDEIYAEKTFPFSWEKRELLPDTTENNESKSVE